MASTAGHHSSERLDLSEDLALAKASLLYAGQVKLCSVGSSLLSTMAEFEEVSEIEQAKLVVRYLSDFQPSVSADQVRYFEAIVVMRPRSEVHAVKSKTARRSSLWFKEQRRVQAPVTDPHRAAGIEGFREAMYEFPCWASGMRPPRSSKRSSRSLA